VIEAVRETGPISRFPLATIAAARSHCSNCQQTWKAMRFALQIEARAELLMSRVWLRGQACMKASGALMHNRPREGRRRLQEVIEIKSIWGPSARPFWAFAPRFAAGRIMNRY
jgi:hypothetical protein